MWTPDWMSPPVHRPTCSVSAHVGNAPWEGQLHAGEYPDRSEIGRLQSYRMVNTGGVFLRRGSNRTPILKEYSKDTQGNHILPANMHIDKIPANGGQLEHLDLPADARIKRKEQGAGCILLRYKHKIQDKLASEKTI